MTMTWVLKYTNPSLKDMKELSETSGYPFKDWVLKGQYDGKGFKLINPLFGSSDDAIKLQVAPNWRVRVRIETENNSYFQQNTINPTDFPAGGGISLSETEGFFKDNRSVIKANLNGNAGQGDYVSIDVDSAVKNVANFRLRVNGEMVNKSSPDNVNNETWIYIEDVYHYEEADVEIAGPLLPEGTGDIDGDGVPDGEDFDPRDPDVQEEGDIDPQFDEPTQEELEDEQIEERDFEPPVMDLSDIQEAIRQINLRLSALESGNGNGGNGDSEDTTSTSPSYLWAFAGIAAVLVAVGVIKLRR